MKKPINDMRKLFPVLLLLTLLLSACGDSDNSKANIPKDHPILGTWILSDYRVSINTDNSRLTDILRNYIIDEYQSDDSGELGSLITFKQNGKATMEDYASGETTEASFSIDESNFLTLKVGKDQMTMEFNIIGNKLQFITDLLNDCKRYAIHLGYSDATIYNAEFIEEYTAL